MDVDRERVADKLVFIADQVSAAGHLLRSRTKREILDDAWVERGLRYTLQTAVEAMIDVSYHVCARLYGHVPANAKAALGKLAERGLITRDELDIYTQMVGFRNKLVHGYAEVSPEQVYEAAVSGLNDFERFMRSFKRLLSSR